MSEEQAEHTTGRLDSHKMIADMPIVEGVYMLINNEEIVYIGQSKQCITRLSQHIRGNNIQFDAVRIFVPINGYDRRNVEAELIYKHHPKHNKKYPRINQFAPLERVLDKTNLTKAAFEALLEQYPQIESNVAGRYDIEMTKEMMHIHLHKALTGKGGGHE